MPTDRPKTTYPSSSAPQATGLSGRAFARLARVATILLGALTCTPAFADVVYNMPAPGVVTLATAAWGEVVLGAFIISRAADDTCHYQFLGQQVEDNIVINGTSGSDAYVQFGADGSAVEFCGLSVSATTPSFPYELHVNLGSGQDTAVLFMRSDITVHGGPGDDLLRQLGSNSNHPAPILFGDLGDDIVIGAHAYGGAGNDVLCSVNEDDIDHWFADGGPGYDTFCGGNVYPTRRISVEHYRGSECPMACRGLLGW